MSLLPPEKIEKSKVRNIFLANNQVGLQANGTETRYLFDSVHPTVETFSGQQNPWHEQQLEQFIQAATPFTAWREEVVSVPCSFLESINWNFYTAPSRIVLVTTNGHFRPDVITDASVSSINTASATNLALSDLAQAIYDAHTVFQGGTFIGELRETIALLRSPARAIRKSLPDYLNSLSKRVKRGTKRREANRIVSETYLEWKFGVTPLLNDVNDAFGAINGFVKAKNVSQDITLRGTGKTETTVPGSEKTVGTAYCFALGQQMQHQTVSVRFLAGYRLNDNPINNGAFRAIGLSPTDWLPTAWNLLPWSFVVDYFTNIGDIVTALANVTASPRWIIKTTKQSVVNQVSFKGIRPYHLPAKGLYSGTVVDTNVKRGSLLQTKQKVTRELYDGRSRIPSLEFQIPGMGTKWINLAALGSLMLDRRRKLNHKLT